MYIHTINIQCERKREIKLHIYKIGVEKRDGKYEREVKPYRV